MVCGCSLWSATRAVAETEGMRQDILAPEGAVAREGARQRALSQITENRKVWTRKPLIFQYTIFGFCLEKAFLRQSPPSRRAVAQGQLWHAE